MGQASRSSTLPKAVPSILQLRGFKESIEKETASGKFGEVFGVLGLDGPPAGGPLRVDDDLACFLIES